MRSTGLAVRDGAIVNVTEDERGMKREFRLQRIPDSEPLVQHPGERQRVGGETMAVMPWNIIRPRGPAVGWHGCRARNEKVRWATVNSRGSTDKKPCGNKPNASASYEIR